MTSAMPVQRSTNWAKKPIGSWSSCWFQNLVQAWFFLLFFFLSLISTISFVVFINARIASIYSRKLDGFIFGLWESENTTYVLMTGREEWFIILSWTKHILVMSGESLGQETYRSRIWPISWWTWLCQIATHTGVKLTWELFIEQFVLRSP